MRIRNVHEGERIQLQMTPMIDIVFQLLVFFIMTFNVVAMEGDFSISMPLSAPRQGPPDVDPIIPMKLRLQADSAGELAAMSIDDRPFQTLDDLRNFIRGFVENDAPGSKNDQEVELDFDFDLKYKWVIAAITAITGYTTGDGQVVTLIENIKFAPPRTPN